METLGFEPSTFPMGAEILLATYLYISYIWHIMKVMSLLLLIVMYYVTAACKKVVF